MRAIFLNFLRGGFAGLCCAVLAASASGQDTPLFPEPAPLVVAESLGEALLEQPAPAVEVTDDDSALLIEPAPAPTEQEPARAGRWRVAPHLEARATFDDNIFIQPKNEVEDLIFTTGVGLAAGYWDDGARRENFRDREGLASLIEKGAGNFFVADYTAILLGFVRTSSENAVDHDGRLSGQWRLEKLLLGATVHAESRSETNVEIGTRLRREALEVALTARYELSAKTAVEVDLFHDTRDYEDFVRSQEERVEGFFEYSVTPELRVSFGLAAGQVDLEEGADQVFERILGRVAYGLSEKVEVVARGGVEFRQSDGDVSDETNPIFELTANYTPAPGTRVGLEGHRRVETSAFRPEENLTRTGGALTLRRAVRDGLHLTLEGGYEHTDYTGSQDGDRTDRYFFVRPGLLYNFAYWGNAAVGYEHRRNDSSRDDADFKNNQVFVEVGLSY